MSTLREALSSLPDAVFADLLEAEDAYRVVIDLSGATDHTADIRIDQGRIQIQAEREKDIPPEFEYVSEDRSLFLDFELPLPPDAVSQGATATLDHGVLELTLPKQSGVEGQTIPIE